MLNHNSYSSHDRYLCSDIVDGKRGGRNSNVLLNGFRYSKRKVNQNGSVIWSCRVPGCKCTLTSGADLNVIRNPCSDHTYSTDTDSTAAALLVNNMRKRARKRYYRYHKFTNKKDGRCSSQA